MPFATHVIMLLLAIASITDLRSRQVPAWVTLGGSGAGLLVAAASGWEALQLSLVGLAVGGLLLLPFVLAGGLGEGDSLLLATVGAWQGWQFVLWTAWWAALIGAGLALIARSRGQRVFRYGPAMAVGSALALLISP